MLHDNAALIKDICDYYRKHFSESLADEYTKFYMDRKSQIIVTSAYELIMEMQGEEMAKKIVAPLIHKYKLPALW